MWFRLKKVRTLGIIERISIQRLKDQVLNEVAITYKYYFQGGLYYGKGYLYIHDFLKNSEFRIYLDGDEEPILEIGSERWKTEEHIESMLLSRYPSVFVYFDPLEPYRSRLDSLNYVSSVDIVV